MKDVCSNHALSIARCSPAQPRLWLLRLSDCAVSVEVLVETFFDSAQQTGWHLVVGALLGNHAAQLGVKVEGLQAIRAMAQVAVNGFTGIMRKLAVEESSNSRNVSLQSDMGTIRRLGARSCEPMLQRVVQQLLHRFFFHDGDDSSGPTGMSSMSAISLYEKSCTSAKSTGIRKISGALPAPF